MARLKSCQYCFGIHPIDIECNNKPKINYKTKKESLDEINQRENTFYSSNTWRKFRANVMKDYVWKCEICSQIYNDTDIKHFTEACELHHIEYIRDAWDKRLDEENVICLCHEHHRLTHNNNIRNKKDLAKFILELKDNNY